MFKPQQILRVLVAEAPGGEMTNLVDFFRFRGFQSTTVTTSDVMMQELKAPAYHVVVLDSEYLGGSGEGIVTQVRRIYGYQAGVIVLLRDGGPKSRIRAMNVGADACLERPVDLEELEAVAWQIYQRLRLSNSTIDDTGAWAFYPGSGVLASPNGQRINLTGSESRVISALAENCGRVVNRQTLIDIMAPGGAPEDTRRLDVVVSRLRAKVKSKSGNELSIKTFRNMGYALSDIQVIA
ncbi:DNA-binding response regulator, OmpR family, contains REC and winged-helix (wHTH) domain [Marinobacter sp. DSM 26671]|jgi:DNA-binding response OmpR family regulator|uniref:response regulator transcription factor n=1 Tax=Marinobacter sp. DSM 26671 TaxID=1761793 RepID=UPI0008EDAF70|nr:response regulator transcription factor [Marinobacter sp. DSM 26671]SFD95621.1 DNA-binding response regulator, OmpR family, contains REC and winged-helix (wHTH) domain [Marinobacter sp. DSM 26671]